MDAHAAQAPAAPAVPLPVAGGAASQPVLPPRPPGQSYADEPKASGWRSWPMLVIILATVAIVVAVVLMVWPAHGGRRELDGKHSLAPPPAPERMQTEPEVKQPPQANPQTRPAPPQAGATRDPWTDQADPPPPDPSASTIDPDSDPNDHDLDGTTDPFATPRGSSVPGRRHLKTNVRGMVWLAMMTHVCRKMAQCGTNDVMAQSTCDQITRTPLTPPGNCPAADRCLQHIDTMGCGGQIDDLSHLSRLLMQFEDCVDATQC